jgi:hypothetical protein
MVTEIHPASEMLASLSLDIKELVRKRLIERIVGGSSGEEASSVLQFSHKFVQESVYESCLVSTRKQLHRSIAKLLELAQSDKLSTFYSIIAHHYSAAEEWRPACLYLQLASENSEKLEMSYAVVSELTAWQNIRPKLNLRPNDNAVNGRFATAGIEEGVMAVSLAKSYNKLGRYLDARDLCIFGIKKLTNSDAVPASKLGKIYTISRGLAKVQLKAVSGGNFSFDATPEPSKEALHDSYFLLCMLLFRRLQDTTGYLTVLSRSLATEGAPVKARMQQFTGMVVVAPVLGLTRVFEFCVREANRLASECGDEVVASSFLSMINGFAYSGKGELIQAASVFSKSASEMYKLRDFEQWANMSTFSALCLFENGQNTRAREILKKTLNTAMEIDNATAVYQACLTMHDEICWGSQEEAQEWFELFDSKVSEKLTAAQSTDFGYSVKPWLMHRCGLMEEEDMINNMILGQEAGSWSKTHLLVTNRAMACACFFDIYDNLKNRDRGGEVMNEAERIVKFLEKLSHSPMVRCWSLCLRGGLMRRRGKLIKAMEFLIQGIESASRTHSKVCLAYLWLERGHCEASGASGAKSAQAMGLRAHEVSGERSFRAAVGFGLECNLPFIIEKGKLKLTAIASSQREVASEHEIGLDSGGPSIARVLSSDVLNNLGYSRGIAGLSNSDMSRRRESARISGRGASERSTSSRIDMTSLNTILSNEGALSSRRSSGRSGRSVGKQFARGQSKVFFEVDEAQGLAE